jgi:hypothetical protein
MVVGVFKTNLQCVVINIRNGKLGFYPINPHCFKLQIRHGAGSILR